MSKAKGLIESLRAMSIDDKTISEESRAIRRKLWDKIESNINEATRLGHSISLFDMVEYLDYACHYSEDDESEISNSNTISPEHTSDNCCEEVIVYNVTDIACESCERIIESEAIMESDSVFATHKNSEPVVGPGTSMDNNGAGISDTCRYEEVLDEFISDTEVFMEDGEVNDTGDNKVTTIMVNNNEPPRNQFHVQTPQNQPQSQQHKNTTQQFNTNLLATVTENDSFEKQFNQSIMKNVSYKNKTVMYGLYPAEIRDNLVYNNDTDTAENLAQ